MLLNGKFMLNGWYEYGPEDAGLFHYVNGELHNLKSPSIIWEEDGVKELIFQNKIRCNSQEKFEKLIKLKLLW